MSQKEQKLGITTVAAARAASDLLWPSMKHVVDSLLRTLRSSWKSGLIFEHNICSVATAIVSDPQIIWIQGQLQIQKCNSAIEGDNLTNIPDEDRDGMETTRDP